MMMMINKFFSCFSPLPSVGAGVTASPLVQTVAEGSDVEFLFTVTGSPLPNIEWFKDAVGGQELNFAPPRLTSGE